MIKHFQQTRRVIPVIVMTAIMLAGGKGRAADAQSDSDDGWPRIFEKGAQRVVQHQPQIDSWVDFERVEARCALAVTLEEGGKPLFGVFAIKARTLLDHAARTVLITEPETTIRFPDTDVAVAAKAEAVAREILPNQKSMILSMDRILAFLDVRNAQQREVPVNMEPPPIFYSSKPAILVNFIGPPEFEPVPGTRLKAAANTNWDLFELPDGGGYRLLNGEGWLAAPDPVKGPWTAAPSAPAEIAELPDDANWADARKAVPGKASSPAPLVVVSLKPAELIITEGPPRMVPVEGTPLKQVENTDSEVFLASDGAYYYLVAGRWFRAKALEGPWTAASGDLPADFAQIPEDSPADHIRRNVPGTREAEDAILLASVPETARVKRDATVEVSYDGDPVFKPIEGTQVRYALNTPSQVFLAAGKYYCCHLGVWFVASGPTGPWTVATSIPDEIYAIPPTHPAHNVTYVYVYGDDPDWITYGYTAGYRGEYVAAGLLVFGAGVVVGEALDDDWRYISHYHSGPQWYSYGGGAIYDFDEGRFVRAAHAYGPYGGAGRGGYYNPSTGAWGRAGYIYGPDGVVAARHSYNPWTDTYVARAGGRGVYGSWGRTYVESGDEWLRAGHRAGDDAAAGWVRTSEGTGGVRVVGEERKTTVVRGDEGNIYVGADGRVYRRDESGEWSRHQGGDWQSIGRAEDHPEPRGPGKPGQPSTLPAGRPTRTEPPSRAEAPSRPSTRPAEPARPSTQPVRPRPGDVTWSSRQPATADARMQLERQAGARSQGQRTSTSRVQRSAPSVRQPAGRSGGAGRRR